MADLFSNPNDLALASMGLRLMSTPGKFGPALGTAGLGALQDLQWAQQVAKQRQMQERVLAERQEELRRKRAEEDAAKLKETQLDAAYRGAFVSPAEQALSGGGGPTVGNAAAMQGMRPRVDTDRLIEGLMKIDPRLAFQMAQPKPDDYKVVGDSLVSVGPGGVKEAYRPAPKPDKLPNSVQEFLYAQQNPAFSEWDRANRRAGATNIGLPRIDIKTGEGIAGQVGPMLKGTQEQAMAGIKLVDSAERILSATQGGNVIVGPMAELRLKTAQVADLFGIGGADNAQKIENTRSVVRGMAEQAVAARSQLGGQAQISNSEQELLNKATSGSIGELTAKEVVQIANLNKRLGTMLYGRHQSMLEGLKRVPDTQNLIPFFQVPPLPQIDSAPVAPAKPTTSNW